MAIFDVRGACCNMTMLYATAAGQGAIIPGGNFFVFSHVPCTYRYAELLLSAYLLFAGTT